MSEPEMWTLPLSRRVLTQQPAAVRRTGEATRLAYMADAAAEDRDAFLEKLATDWVGLPLILLMTDPWQG